MKLIILRSNLLETLGIIERAVPVNPNLPILEDVLIEADQSKIIFHSSNLELGIECASTGKVLEAGSVSVPFKVLADVVRNLNNEKVSLETREGRLFLSTDNYEASLQSHDTKEFPLLPGIESQEFSFRIQSATLYDSLSSVIIATQLSEIRPEISGVYLSITKESVVFVATDGFRLAERFLDASSVVKSPDCHISCIIPLKSAAEVLRIISAKDISIHIIIEPNQIHFISESARVVSRLTDGKFPDYTAIIPKDFHAKIRINRQEFHDAVKLVSSLSGKSHDVTLKAVSGGNYLELLSQDQVRGENLYRVPIKLEGEAFSVIFNWRYLIDGLKIFRSEDIEMNLSGTLSDRPGPALICSQKEKHLLYVIMPIRN